MSQVKTGDAVRYKPGYGTYGYEDLLEADGRVPARVIGFSRTRVRIEFLFGRLRGVTRCVDAASLSQELETFHAKLAPAAQ